MAQRAEGSNDIEEIRASQKLQKKQRESIAAMRDELEEVQARKDKLLKSELKISKRIKTNRNYCLID